MATLTITVNDEQLDRFQETARKMGVTVEELACLSMDDYTARHHQFEGAANYVLKKNAELYRRLAQ